MGSKKNVDIDYNTRMKIIINAFGEDYYPVKGKPELRYNCPFCPTVKGKAYNDYKFYVNVWKMKYWCFHCESSGSLIDDSLADVFIEPNSSVINEIVEYLSKDSSDLSIGSSDELPLYDISMMRPEPGERSYDYLIGRGWTHDDIYFYDVRVGEIGTDMFGRIVIPNRVYDGCKTDMYVGRSYLGSLLRYKNADNAPRNKIVFNLHRIPMRSKRIIICEGVFSAAAAGRDAVATYGKYVSDIQLRMILAKHPEKLYISLDPDAIDKAEELCDRARKMDDRVDIRLVELPDGKDPDDVGRKYYPYYLEKAIPYESAAIFQIRRYLDRLE